MLAVPAQHLRSHLAQLGETLAEDAVLVSLIKGLERGSDMRMSEVIGEELGLDASRIAVVSGPNLAMEIAREEPTASVVACRDEAVAEQIATLCSAKYFRPYTNTDVTGVEIAGIVKNVIALAVGVCDGQQLGDNSKASVITRGLAEATRLATALGGKLETFSGLAGLGDVVATCASPLSRNRSAGRLLGQGLTPEQVTEQMTQTAEGMKSASAVLDLAREHGVEMPITEAVTAVLAGRLPVQNIASLLLARELKAEQAGGASAPTPATSSAKPRILVLYGGQSSEHAVSCVTAAGVLRAIDTSRFEVVEVGITAAGQWTRPVTDPRSHSFDGAQLPRVEPTASSVQLHPGAGGSAQRSAELVEIAPDLSVTSLGRVDAVLPLLHGPFGEDGTLQGLLELAGVPYVGAGVLTSAVGMDKHFMKLAFAAAGLTVGPWETITARQWAADPEACLQRVRQLTLPVFVKPARAGSSTGITRVDDWSQLEQALETARKFDPKVIVEQGIQGREIECGVLGSAGGAAARTSECGEIVVHQDAESHQFYDFTAKYTDDAAAELSCPADLPAGVSDEIRRQAVIAFNAIDGEGISRVDFFYTSEGELVINEVNTMPGFTPISMYPQMWKASGLNYTELITELIQLALDRPVGLR